MKPDMREMTVSLSLEHCSGIELLTCLVSLETEPGMIQSSLSEADLSSSVRKHEATLKQAANVLTHVTEQQEGTS